jgi:hypothetical protein
MMTGIHQNPDVAAHSILLLEKGKPPKKEGVMISSFKKSGQPTGRYALSFCLSFFVLSFGRVSEAQTRNFQMALWGNEGNQAPIDADVAFFHGGDTQPSGHSILKFSFWNTQGAWQSMVSKMKYDFSRIDAVAVDEPYWTTIGTSPLPRNVWQNPCQDNRYPRVASSYQMLQSLGQAVKQTSSRTRFWINFSEPEIQWMMDTNCPANRPITLNGSFVDVVSLDRYKILFEGPCQVTLSRPAPCLQPYYDWILAHRAYAGQQIALVPGVFVRILERRTGPVRLDDPNSQTALLAGFFNYAATMNQSCSLPLGATGFTGVFDGCLVWLVIGYPGESWTENPKTETPTQWLGEFDPNPVLQPIQAAWRSELSIPIRRNVAGNH